MCQPCFPNKNPAIPFCGSERIRTSNVYPVGTDLQSVATPPPSLHSHMPLSGTQRLRESNPLPCIFENTPKGSLLPFGITACTIYWNRTSLLWALYPVSLVSLRTCDLQLNFVATQFQPDCSFHLCLLQPSHMAISQCVCITS